MLLLLGHISNDRHFQLPVLARIGKEQDAFGAGVASGPGPEAQCFWAVPFAMLEGAAGLHLPGLGRAS